MTPEDFVSPTGAAVEEDVLQLLAAVLKSLGGPGSGNYGHVGRPGQEGGSAPINSVLSVGGSTAADSAVGSKEFTARLKQVLANSRAVHDLTNASNDHKYNFKYEGPLAKSLSAYVGNDARPKGKLTADLERAIATGTEMADDVISYRGVSLTPSQFKQMREGVEFQLGHPSSFTDQESTAWDFVKPRGRAGRSSKVGGFRYKAGNVPVVLRALVPKGTKAAYLNLSFGVGSEHVLSGKEKYVVRQVQKWRDGFRVDVELV